MLDTRALFLQTVVCGTRTVYVSGGGDDANPGTAARPLRQIATAVSSAQPGDLILVDSGTYDYVDVYNFIGSATAWLAIMSLNDAARPVIDVSSSLRSDGSANDGVDVQISSFVGLYGLEVRGNQNSTDTNPSGICVFRGSHHVFVWGNDVHDFPGGGVNCFYVDEQVFGGTTLPAGGWDLVDVSFNTIHDCCKYSPNNTSGISFYGAVDTTQTTLDGRYGYRAVGNYIYNCICTVPYTPGGFSYVTDGNGISIDSLSAPYASIPSYTKRGLVEGNLITACGGRAVHVFNSINVDGIGNTAVGNLRTDSPAINGGVAFDSTVAGGDVVWTGNVILPLHTPNTTDTISSYVDNVVAGGTQAVPAGNTDHRSAGLGYCAPALAAADLTAAQPLSSFVPQVSDMVPLVSYSRGYQVLGAGPRPADQWSAGALEQPLPVRILAEQPSGS